MSLGKNQEHFAYDFARLILHAYHKCYAIRIGDVWAKSGEGRRHKKSSIHYKKCAGDLNLFKDGKYLTGTEDHRFLGDFWESLSPENRWGGRYDDGNHYERVPGGWRK